MSLANIFGHNIRRNFSLFGGTGDALRGGYSSAAGAGRNNSVAGGNLLRGGTSGTTRNNFVTGGNLIRGGASGNLRNLARGGGNLVRGTDRYGSRVGQARASIGGLRDQIRSGSGANPLTAQNSSGRYSSNNYQRSRTVNGGNPLASSSTTSGRYSRELNYGRSRATNDGNPLSSSSTTNQRYSRERGYLSNRERSTNPLSFGNSSFRYGRRATQGGNLGDA